MSTAELEDTRWLVSDAAQAYLDRAGNAGQDLVPLAQSLRRELSAVRTHLVLEQIELRTRARAKFHRADEMFFTRRALEQATSEAIADYKAARFPKNQPAADVCCGIGGDFLSLARRGPATGVELDPVTSLLAAANSAVCGASAATVITGDACDARVADFAAWHIDPDRRAAGDRVSQVESYQPSLDTLDRLLAENPNAAVKLAPAAVAPQSWSAEAELQWIGHDRECKQQLAWFGSLARHAGQHVATVIDAAGRASSVVGCPKRVDVADKIGRFVFEPHAAVLAADLVGELSQKHELAAVAMSVAYLTADGLVEEPTVAAFEVREVLPLDMKRLKALLRQRRIGQLEVKKRGVPHDPADVRSRLKVPGDHRATLLLYGSPDGAKAILADRVPAPVATRE